MASLSDCREASEISNEPADSSHALPMPGRRNPPLQIRSAKTNPSKYRLLSKRVLRRRGLVGTAGIEPAFAPCKGGSLGLQRTWDQQLSLKGECRAICIKLVSYIIL